MILSGICGGLTDRITKSSGVLPWQLVAGVEGTLKEALEHPHLALRRGMTVSQPNNATSPCAGPCQSSLCAEQALLTT